MQIPVFHKTTLTRQPQKLTDNCKSESRGCVELWYQSKDAMFLSRFLCLKQKNRLSLQYLCDRRIPDPQNAFQQGQAVIAKVTEVDYERKRILVSLRMQNCYHGDTEIGVDLLEDYLKEYNTIWKTYENKKGQFAWFPFLSSFPRAHCFVDSKDPIHVVRTFTGKKSRLTRYKVGQIVKTTVKEVNEHGAICQVEESIQGIATEEHIGGRYCRAPRLFSFDASGPVHTGAWSSGHKLPACFQQVCPQPRKMALCLHLVDDQCESYPVGQTVRLSLKIQTLGRTMENKQIKEIFPWDLQKPSVRLV